VRNVFVTASTYQ